MKTNLLTRRQFTRRIVTATAVTYAAPAFLRGQNLNNKLNIAIIGAGGRGGSNMDSVSSENIVALCDVNAKNLNAAAAKHSKAWKTPDFRKLFDRAGEFDAVVVSTCEHTHAYAAVPALQMGKAVYREKPMSRDVQECRIMREAAAKAKVAT